MWLLSHGNPISLPHLILLHMKHVSTSPHFYPYGIWLTRVFRAFDVLTPTSKGSTCRDIMNDGMLSRMELCAMGGELLKKYFLEFQPKEACVGSIKIQEEVGQVKNNSNNSWHVSEHVTGLQHSSTDKSCRLSLILKPTPP